MSTSPFELFRRNLKPLMVLLTMLALFAFVVLPALQSYLQRGVTAGSDPAVAVIDGTPIKRSRIEFFTRTHQSVVRFLSELAQETIARGGAPRTPGFEYDTESGQIASLGIGTRPSEIVSIRTLQWSSEAQKVGFELDDAAIRNWLLDFTDGLMSDSEIVSRLMQSTNNQMGRYHLYDQLRHQLLSDLFVRAGMVGIARGSMPIVTPAEQWDNFLKLNRQATAEAYGVLVDDYIDQTDPAPSEAEVARVYEEGKDRFPSDRSPEPGFRRPYVATFEYVAANLNSFIDREVDRFDEETLREEYQRRRAGGDFQLPKEETEAEPSTSPEEPASSEESEAASEPGPAEPGEPSGESDQPEPSAGDGSDAPDESDQGRRSPDPAVRLVVAQDADSPEEADEPSDASGDSGASDKPVAPEQPDASEGNEPADSEESDSSEPDGESPAEDTPSEDAAMSEDNDAEDADAEASGDADGESDAEASAPEVRSFDEVRNEIADDLARPEARQKAEQAIQEVNSEMQRYFQDLAIYESMQAAEGTDPGPAPERPNLQELAESLGLEYGQLESRNVRDIQDDSIAGSVEPGGGMNQRQTGFVDMMYGLQTQQGQLPRQPLYSPLRTIDPQASVQYLTWKTDERESYVPALDEVREEVIEAVRRAEARELARAEAEQLRENFTPETDAESAQQAGRIGEPQMANWKAPVGPFSWMNAFGFGQASIGEVPELDGVGEAFMKEVFGAEPNRWVVAPNDAGSVIYLVKPTEFQPSIDELRRRFLQPQERIMATFIESGPMQSIQEGFIDGIDERSGFDLLLEREP